MIPAQTIADIFVKYNSLPADADICTERHLNDLMMLDLDSEFIDFDGDKLTLAKGGVVSEIEIERIAGAEDLGELMAIVLPASVITVRKADGDVRISLPELQEA